jgi:membrane protein implicated in regulation of membrane protease activity
MQRLTPARGPLPPQRWGFLPTEQFWRLAALTPPISVVFWLGAFAICNGLLSIGLPWWQNGLGCLVFTALWAGLVERWSRGYLVRRRARALSEPEGQRHEARSDLVPTQEPQRGLPVVATSEFWDYAFERLFGRGKTVAYVVFSALFFMAAFYPSWLVVLGSISVVVAISLGLGWWQRRLLRSQLEGDQTGPELVEESPRPSLPATTDRARSPDRPVLASQDEGRSAL